MLFQVEMRVRVPAHLDRAAFEQLRESEKAVAHKLQQQGKWRHIWRVVGKYKNISIFDVADNEELHTILTSLPLYPYMRVKVMPLCRHPSSIRDDDR